MTTGDDQRWGTRWKVQRMVAIGAVEAEDIPVVGHHDHKIPGEGGCGPHPARRGRAGGDAPHNRVVGLRRVELHDLPDLLRPRVVPLELGCHVQHSVLVDHDRRSSGHRPRAVERAARVAPEGEQPVDLLPHGRPTCAGPDVEQRPGRRRRHRRRERHSRPGGGGWHAGGRRVQGGRRHPSVRGRRGHRRPAAARAGHQRNRHQRRAREGDRPRARSRRFLVCPRRFTQVRALRHPTSRATNQETVHGRRS